MNENDLQKEHFYSEMGKCGIYNTHAIEEMWVYAKGKLNNYGPLGMATGLAIAASSGGLLVVGSAALAGFAVGKVMVTRLTAGGDRVLRDMARSCSQPGSRFNDDNW